MVAAAAFVVFLPGIFGDFLNWDDDRNFTDQPYYRGLGWPQIVWMFSAFHMGHYSPVTWLTLGADYILWGMRPRGYHLTSLIFHAAAAVAFLLVAHRLIRRAFGGGSDAAVRIGAVATALAFAVHPLRAESVVWLSERRDVVSGLLYMLTVLAYLKAVGDAPPGTPLERPRWYGLSLVLFAAAVLSKALVVSLPVVLVIIDVYPLRRLGGAAGWRGPAPRRVWLEKLPFLALGAAGAILAFAARAPLRAAPDMAQFDLGARLVTSVYGLAFYVWKTVWPTRLSPLYEMPLRLDLVSWWSVTSVVAVLLLSLAAVAARRRWPAVTAAGCAYVVTLIPVIGIVQSGPQITADRYTYLACLGWALVFGGAMAWCAERWLAGRAPRLAYGAGLSSAAALVLAMAGLAASQSLVWQNSITLWTHALDLDPRSARAHTGLAGAYLAEGKPAEAERALEAAVRLNPVLPEALMGIALVRSTAGRGQEAIGYATRAIRLVPHDASAYRFLAAVYGNAGQRDAELAAYRQAIALDPRSPMLRYAVAVRLAEADRTQEAVAALAEADELARVVGFATIERERFAALVYSRVDRERSREAWTRYLAALSRIERPTHEQLVRRVQALAALVELDRPASRPTP